MGVSTQTIDCTTGQCLDQLTGCNIVQRTGVFFDVKDFNILCGMATFEMLLQGINKMFMKNHII